MVVGGVRVAVPEGTGRDGERWLYLSGGIVNGCSAPLLFLMFPKFSMGNEHLIIRRLKTQKHSF